MLEGCWRLAGYCGDAATRGFRVGVQGSETATTQNDEDITDGGTERYGNVIAEKLKSLETQMN